MKFEDLLAEVGGFGWFQAMIAMLLVIPRVTLPFHFLLNNFIANVPSHHCDISSLDPDGIFGNLSQEQRLIISVPADEDGKHSSCLMFPEPQFHLLSNSSNSTELPAVQCQNGWMFDTSSRTLATEWDLVCDKKGLNKTTATVFFTGVMIGAIVFGILSDRYGRKRMLLVTYLSTITFALASAFSHSYTMFAVMRFFTGLSISGLSIIAIVLCMEWVDIKHRTFVGVIVSCDWSVSTMLLPGLAYFVRDWRYLIITVTSPLGLALITWWLVPESARWLIANGRLDEAYGYLAKCASVNRRQQNFKDIKPETLSTIIMAENRGNRTYSYLDLLRTPKMKKLALVTGITWYGVAFTYYGISLNVSGFGLNLYLTQFIYGSIEVPSKLLIYVFLCKVGRRPSQAVSLAMAGVCIGITTLIPKDIWLFRTIVSVLGKGFSEAAFTIVIIYTAELYPTVLRQNGVGYCSSLARLGVAMAPLVLLLEDVWTPLPQVLFCSVAIAAGLTALLLPETNNVRLPETIEDIEKAGELNHELN